MPIFDPPAKPTAWNSLVMALHAVLDGILALEKRDAPTLFFGTKYQGSEDRMPLVGWQHNGGRFSLNEPQIMSAPSTVVGWRRVQSVVKLWHFSPEELEHLLDRLWLASSRLVPDGSRFDWEKAAYAFPTESQGPLLANGASVIELHIPVVIDVAFQYDGETVDTVLNDTQLRAGLEDVIDTTTPGQPEFNVNEWQ